MNNEALIPFLIFSFVGLLLIFMGIVVHKYKKYDLIAGYNSMSEEMKSQFDIEKYARIFGIVFYIMGSLTVLGSLLDYVFHLLNSNFGMIFSVIILGGVFFLVTVGGIFKRKFLKR